MKYLLLWITMALVGCADPAFQTYITNRQAAIASMPNGQAKYYAQMQLDQQILADKQRQNQQAANAGAAIAAGMVAGAAAYSASQPRYIYQPVVYPVYPIPTYNYLVQPHW